MGTFPIETAIETKVLSPSTNSKSPTTYDYEYAPRCFYILLFDYYAIVWRLRFISLYITLFVFSLFLFLPLCLDQALDLSRNSLSPIWFPLRKTSLEGDSFRLQSMFEQKEQWKVVCCDTTFQIRTFVWSCSGECLEQPNKDLITDLELTSNSSLLLRCRRTVVLYPKIFPSVTQVFLKTVELWYSLALGLVPFVHTKWRHLCSWFSVVTSFS